MENEEKRKLKYVPPIVEVMAFGPGSILASSIGVSSSGWSIDGGGTDVSTGGWSIDDGSNGGTGSSAGGWGIDNGGTGISTGGWSKD